MYHRFDSYFPSMDKDERIPYCINGCGEPAVAEELYGVSDDGLEIVELVCYDCKNK